MLIRVRHHTPRLKPCPAAEISPRMPAAARAALDEARLKARLERNQRTPGPGAYDARLPHNSNTVRRTPISKPPSRSLPTCHRTIPVQNAGSAAFKSSTKRGKDAELTFMGDPGSYDPHTATELGTLSKKSFGKSLQSGAGGFGSTSKARQELVQPGDGASPGPGSYTIVEPGKPEAKQTSGFASKTKRGQYAKASDAPGVGSYEPILQQPAVLGGQSSFKSGAQRFKTTDTSESHIGPGSYSVNVNSIESGMSASASKTPAPFGTSTKRPDMSIPTDTPGPGAYTVAPVATSGSADGRPSSAFKSSTKRGKDAELTFMGDPGSYDPHTATELGTLSKKSFGKSLQSGAGGFGSTSKARQELVQPGDGASPGPGSYTIVEPGKPEAKQTSGFASKTKRGQYAKASDAPGVGSYEPILQQPAVLGGQSSFKSGAQRFKKTDAAESHIGPGTYSVEADTITAKASADVGKVSSAFASTTLRDGFLGV